MIRIVIVILLLCALTACTFSGIYLEPPQSNSTSDTIAVDMQACVYEAQAPRELTAEEQALIDGKETARLFMNGRPVITPDGKPALHQSAFPQPSNKLADRYAVCLLQKGYTWEQK